MHPVTSLTTSTTTTTTTTLFNFHDHTIRTQLDAKGDLWFVAVDICAALGVQNSSQALSRLDDDEKGLYKCYTLGGMQTLAAVNEPGLYALVFSSRKAEARAVLRSRSFLPVQSWRMSRSEGC